jgi:hypothetical protein
LSEFMGHATIRQQRVTTLRRLARNDRPREKPAVAGFPLCALRAYEPDAVSVSVTLSAPPKTRLGA